MISSENLDKCDMSIDELLIKSIIKSLSLTLSNALSVIPSKSNNFATYFLSSLWEDPERAPEPSGQVFTLPKL